MSKFFILTDNARINMHYKVFIFFIVSMFSSANPQSNKAAEEDPTLYSIKLEELSFELYTRENSTKKFELIVGDKENLKKSHFNPHNPTKIITHGWENGLEEPFKEMKTEFLKLGPFNVILVDYSKCTKSTPYVQSVICARPVGNHIGTFIKFLAQEGNLNVKDVHLISTSLGAQVLAFVDDVLPQKVGQITGLDPAGPLFTNVPPSERLDPSAADFVDIIHTDSVFFGIKYPVGDANFYVNGGYDQPGCGTGISIEDALCNHAASLLYYLKTVSKSNRNIYVGKKCPSLANAFKGTCNGTEAIMGYGAKKRHLLCKGHGEALNQGSKKGFSDGPLLYYQIQWRNYILAP